MTLGMEVVVVDDAGAECCHWLEITLELGLLLLLWMTLGLGWRVVPLLMLELGGGSSCRCCQW